VIYLLAASLAYGLFLSALHILLANEVTELGAELKKARRENQRLRNPRCPIPTQRNPR